MYDPFKTPFSFFSVVSVASHDGTEWVATMGTRLSNSNSLHREINYFNSSTHIYTQCREKPV